MMTKHSAVRGITSLICTAFAASLYAADFTTKSLARNKPNYYKAAATYPVWNASNPLSRIANPTLKNWVTRSHQDWVSDANKAAPKLTAGSTGLWTQELHYEVKRSDPRIVSVLMSLDVYEGTPHSNYARYTFNFGKIDGKLTRLTLDNLFRKGSNPAKSVHEKLMRKLKILLKQEADGAEIENPVEALTKEQLNNFTIDRKGLTWHFAPSEVAPYVLGFFNVSLSWSELGPNLNRAVVP